MTAFYTRPLPAGVRVNVQDVLTATSRDHLIEEPLRNSYAILATIVEPTPDTRRFETLS